MANDHNKPVSEPWHSHGNIMKYNVNCAVDQFYHTLPTKVPGMPASNLQIRSIFANVVMLPLGESVVSSYLSINRMQDSLS